VMRLLIENCELDHWQRIGCTLRLVGIRRAGGSDQLQLQYDLRIGRTFDQLKLPPIPKRRVELVIWPVGGPAERMRKQPAIGPRIRYEYSSCARYQRGNGRQGGG